MSLLQKSVLRHRLGFILKYIMEKCSALHTKSITEKCLDLKAKQNNTFLAEFYKCTLKIKIVTIIVCENLAT